MQVYNQPLFATVENWFRFKFPDSEFVNNTFILKLWLLPPFELNFLSLSFRTAYVVSTTVIAMIFPYFNQILGVLGSISFWPLTIYFPVELYLSRSSTDAWTAKWIMLRTFSIFGFGFGLFTLIGCIRGIVTEKIGWEALRPLKGIESGVFYLLGKLELYWIFVWSLTNTRLS